MISRSAVYMMFFHEVIPNLATILISYPIESEIKNNTDTTGTVSNFDLHLEIDSDCRLRKQLRQKR